MNNYISLRKCWKTRP